VTAAADSPPTAHSPQRSPGWRNPLRLRRLKPDGSTWGAWLTADRRFKIIRSAERGTPWLIRPADGQVGGEDWMCLMRCQLITPRFGTRRAALTALAAALALRDEA